MSKFIHYSKVQIKILIQKFIITYSTCVNVLNPNTKLKTIRQKKHVCKIQACIKTKV